MEISAKLALWGSVVFALACLGVAITGFLSLSEISDPVQRADSLGYAWFWMFLAAIAVALGFLSWWITKRPSPADPS